MNRRFVIAISVLCCGFPGPCSSFDGASVPAAPFDPYGDAGLLELDDAVKACSWVFQCPRLSSSIASSIGVPLDEEYFALCVHWAARKLPSNRLGVEVQRKLLSCVANAESCDDALGCSFVETLSGAPAECQADELRCSGDTLIDCAGSQATRCDSPLFDAGSHCVEQNGYAACVLDDTCTKSPGHCLGNIRITCDDTLGREAAENCAGAGQSCAEGVAGLTATCRGSLGQAACNVGPLDRVLSTCTAADTAAVCHARGISEFDCAANSETCHSESNPARAWCGGNGPECTPVDDAADVNSCDGSVLSACLNGHIAEVDCGKLGLSCSPASSGRTAHCARP